MKVLFFLVCLLAWPSLVLAQVAQVPSTMTYQGRILQNGTPFSGKGRFMFVIYAGETLTWNNLQGTTNPTKPTASSADWLELEVRNGVFSVVLGKGVNKNEALNLPVFFDSVRGPGVRENLRMEVWFSPGADTPPRKLSPDIEFASVPFAQVAQLAMTALNSTNAVNATNAINAGTATNAVKLAGQDPSFYMPAGVVVAYGGTNEPPGWLFCDGREVSRSTYANLYASIGTAHGAGNGSNTFNLPDYRGVFLRGVADSIPSVAISAVDTAAETLTVTSHPYRRNGVPVRLTGALPAPLATNTTYFTIVVDANKVALATNESDAITASPVKVNLTGSSVSGTILQALDPDAAVRRAPTGNVALSGVGSIQGDGFKTHQHVFGADDQVGPQGGYTSVGATFSYDANSTLVQGGVNLLTKNAPANFGGNETRPINAYVNYLIKY